ncbi:MULTISPECIES: hypothetical protein [Pseudonocardia]|uniref:Uncharacterized protein n=2 Tax=Pseudonocardia TaxID=1847 RepID=A0A1Y2N767_PSEAH|nr:MULTISPECIES: hypothetical protein [Pseudonocardia]OSY43316.1 hypothetical protein BG845_00921 [Pseudonocardia autotrophica]TDN71804.1 hypothetical protein C8E95_0838 [Pseudonocardia autotrophica]BBG02491.1 hypothetical protein Pdca_37000 [Pseudonocardia autotrophica]GEC26928.1 hypothetical protein PSA01_39570 [Pseudonocardia saturnea]
MSRAESLPSGGAQHGAAGTVRGLRRAMIVAVVGSLLVASLLGIVALLGGDFGDLQIRIVLTTLVVAAFGTTALCHLAVVTRAVRVVGLAGIAASIGAAVCALLLIWRDWMSDTGPEEGLFKSLTVFTVLAISLAHANLLLLLAERRAPVIRAGLAATLLAIAIVAVMILLPVLTDGAIPGTDDGWYWRWLGVAGIVDALGTVALPVLALVLRSRPDPAPVATTPAAPGGGQDSVRLVLDLPAGLAARLSGHAGGGALENAVLDAIDRGLAAAGPPPPAGPPSARSGPDPARSTPDVPGS